MTLLRAIVADDAVAESKLLAASRELANTRAEEGATRQAATEHSSRPGRPAEAGRAHQSQRHSKKRSCVSFNVAARQGRCGSRPCGRGESVTQ